MDTLQWKWVLGFNSSNDNTLNQRGDYSAGVGEDKDINALPGGRHTHSFGFLKNMFIVFGGRGWDSNGFSMGSLEDIWTYDGEFWTWKRGSSFKNQYGNEDFGVKGKYTAEAQIRCRETQATAFLGNDEMFIFGGRDASFLRFYGILLLKF